MNRELNKPFDLSKSRGLRYSNQSIPFKSPFYDEEILLLLHKSYNA